MNERAEPVSPRPEELEMLEELVGASRGADGCFAMRPESTFPPEDGQMIDEWMKSLANQVMELLRKANSGDARAALQVIPLLHSHIAELEREAVIVARSSWGWSWNAIGQVLGVKPQSVHERYAREPRCRPRGVMSAYERFRLSRARARWRRR